MLDNPGFFILLAQRKAFSSPVGDAARTRGNAFGMACLRHATRTLRASPRTLTGKQATRSVCLRHAART